MVKNGLNLAESPDLFLLVVASRVGENLAPNVLQRGAYLKFLVVTCRR